ncbi:hypothetical protein ACST14_02625 [Aquirufa sp. A-Brett2-15D]
MSQLVKLIFVLGISCVFSHNSFGQKINWNVGLGNSLTQYQFKNSMGSPKNHLKIGSGSSYAIGFERAILDTSQVLVTSSKKAIYFLKYKWATKVLSSAVYGLKLSVNQYNSVGDYQNYEFIYQTNFLGLEGHAGPKVIIGRGWNVILKGQGSIQRILQGNQLVNGTYVNLLTNSEFNSIMLFLGYGIEFEKEVNKSIKIFISSGNNQSYNSQKNGTENLNFQSTQILLGIKIANIK